MKKKQLKKTLSFNPDKCNDLYCELVEVFKKHKPRVGEILIAASNLLYTLGASIGKFPNKGPTPKEVQEMYLKEPKRLDLAMMNAGIILMAWFDSYEKIQTEKLEEK